MARYTSPLTDRQRAILLCVFTGLQEQPYPPTLREIGQSVGLASTSSVKYQLDALERSGFLEHDPRRPRTLVVTAAGRIALGAAALNGEGASESDDSAHRVASSATEAYSTHAASSALQRNSKPGTRPDRGSQPHLVGAAPYDDATQPEHVTSAEVASLDLWRRHVEKNPLMLAALTTSSDDLDIYPSQMTDSTISIPVVGRIAAGTPITAQQDLEDVFELPERLTGTGELFSLHVHGDSMIDAAICDGDWVVVRRQSDAENGDIVAAMLDGEATVKVFQHADGHTWLLPQNNAYAPIPADHASVLGKVVTVLRSLV
ncbi:MAG: transcriptional repressor LexA [Actinomycetaceae bacterium]|nr:transcriptional repressor LexA [Actinomycetaceae bacterium]MDY6083020.1 transcriptional repressor LexA [Actinomycetaceae bacterium]